jgi:hypothetical protein
VPGKERIWADADIQMQVLQASSQASEREHSRDLDCTSHWAVAGRPRQRIGVIGAEKLRTFTKQVYSRIMICSSKVGKGGSCETNECRETGRGRKGEASCAVKRALLLQESSQEV